MKVKEAWAYGRSQLIESPTPQLDARLILEHVLQEGHSYLVAHGEALLTADQERRFRSLTGRARRKEPVPHLTGHAPFYGLDLIVSPATLIPRPETEQLVAAALDWATPRQPLNVVDVGTGSGCIAICMARHLPEARVDAVDISLTALEVARRNARQHAPNRIQFHQGNLLDPILRAPDLIVANLPYVSDREWTLLDDGVKLHEPAVALKGGDDGLDLIRQLLPQATSKLKAGGAIFLEIGWQQGSSALHLAQSHFPAASIELMPDYAGHDRIIAIRTGQATAH
jgi:release factor glutamine methyltransferase